MQGPAHAGNRAAAGSDELSRAGPVLARGWRRPGTAPGPVAGAAAGLGPARWGLYSCRRRARVAPDSRRRHPGEAPLFTGIIAHTGTVARREPAGPADGGQRVRIACDPEAAPARIGDSVAVAGICLTAVEPGPADAPAGFTADLSPETLARTTAGSWPTGARVNLERPLRVGDELGGHLVSGHVDGTATLVERRAEGNCARFRFRAPAALARLIAGKGSVTLDGVSLTVAEAEGCEFAISLIPHTLAATTLQTLAPGDPVNLEVDLLARHVARLQEFRHA